jgi:hypothetical protein
MSFLHTPGTANGPISYPVVEKSASSRQKGATQKNAE